MRLLIAGFCLMFLFFSTGVSAKIVFESERDGVIGIYVMDDDGSNVTLLTDVLNPSHPRWSPDGKQIVFQRQVNPQDLIRRHIFLMDADGTNIRQLTSPDNQDDWHPAFSPDGTSIVFNQEERINNKSTLSICVMDLASGVIEHIAELGANSPAWSPDGKHIIFTTIPKLGKPGGGNIWRMDADGHKPHELLLPPLAIDEALIVNRHIPTFSLTGKQILYIQTETTFVRIGGVGRNIPQAYRYFIYDLRLRTARQLEGIPKNYYNGGGIAWMDDGKSVIFSAVKIKLKQPIENPRPAFNIYKYHIATRTLTRLTNHPGKDYSLDWIDDKALSVSPEGKLPTHWGQLKSLLPAYRNAFKAVWYNVSTLLRVPISALYR